MRATIAGAPTTTEALGDAVRRVVKGNASVRAIGPWAWTAFPADVRRQVVEQVAATLGQELVVIDVEMALGGRGEDLSAARSCVPERGPEEDLSGQAREMLHEWLADSAGGGFDEDEAIFDLAWALVDEPLPPSEQEEQFEDRWASALVEHLLSSGAIELRARKQVAGELASSLDGATRVDSELAATLLESLVDSTAVAEVYLDEAALEKALRETMPAR
jgi:hypothetical protein